jgi:hypothetical protein
MTSFTSADFNAWEQVGSRRFTRGGLFQPTTITVRIVVQMLCNESGSLTAFDPDAVKYKMQAAGFVMEVGKPFGFAGYTHPILADTTLATGYTASAGAVNTVEGFEVTSIRGTRDTNSANIYYFDIESAIVEQQYLNHAEISLQPQARQTRGFRVNADRPTLASTTTGLVDDVLTDYTLSSDINGTAVDFNTQPITLTLAGTQLILSCVVRSPYFLKATDTALTVSPIWAFWTYGNGAGATGARWADSNGLMPDLSGYRDYEPIVEGVSFTKIVGTFHRMDIVLRIDEWYNLEQIPFSVDGTIPPTSARHQGGTGANQFKITEAKGVAWIDPHPRTFEPDLSTNATLPYNALTIWKNGLGTI